MKTPFRFRLAVLGATMLCAHVAPSYAENVRRDVVMQGTRYETPFYIKTGQLPGPVVVVVGGVHGDEPAGYLAARKVANWRVTRGTLVVMPDAHREAIRRNVRGFPGNMNRMFPGDAHGDAMQQLAFGIWSMIRDAHPDVLITLHESRDFHANDPTRFGQTFCFDFPQLVPSMKHVMSRVNADISPRKNKFLIFVKPYPTCPTYQAWEKLRVPATSVETSKTLPLPTRIRYQLMAVQAFCDEAGLGYEQKDVPPLSSASWPSQPFTKRGKSALPVPTGKIAGASTSTSQSNAGRTMTSETSGDNPASAQTPAIRRPSPLVTMARFGLALSVLFVVWGVWKAVARAETRRAARARKPR